MTGTPCPKCGGNIKVLNTKPLGLTSRVQYCGCGKCGYRPQNNKIVCRSTNVLDKVTQNSIM